MNQVFLKNISYGQLKDGNWLTENDCYGLAAFVNDNVKNTFIDSPFNKDPDKTAIILAVDGGVYSR